MQRMPFGKFRGELLSDIPRDYLEWVQTVATTDRLRRAVQEELNHREFRQMIESGSLKAELARLRGRE